jgi:uncharacterized protein GlcG (DUF336 family)
MLAFPHDWLQNHSNVPVGVFVKINSCRPSLRFLRVAASSNTQIGSIQVSIAKARSSALFKRATKVFEDGLAAGGIGLRALGLEGAVPVEGGLPILANDMIIGAIGVSGGTSQEDGVAANAGVAAL